MYRRLFRDALLVLLLLNCVFDVSPEDDLPAANATIPSTSPACCSTHDANSSAVETLVAPDDFAYKKVVALILARGGSKGLKMKNLQTIGGASLLARSLEVIRNSQVFEAVYVSTDHDDIAEEAAKHGAIVHRRPANVSQDDTSSLMTVEEFLVKHPEVEILALIQCTSVFLRESYLIEAFYRMQTSDCVFAVKRSWKLRWGQRKVENNKLVALNFDPKNRPRRQDWPGELVEVGMFYFASRALLATGEFQNDNCGFVEVEPDHDIEVDNYWDLKKARMMVAFSHTHK